MIPPIRRKRRNNTLWMQNRLRRIDSKIAMADANPQPTWHGVYNDLTPASIERCRDRGHQLGCAIQIEWGKARAVILRGGAK